jgi:F0F1-type ATP synthase assembly protein I
VEQVERPQGLANRFLALVPRKTNKRQLLQGYDDASARSIQLVVTTLLLGFIGHLIDGKAGTGFLFALVLGASGLAWETYRFVQAYTVKMKQAEEGKPWAK